ncbi:MAG: hypothetical protein A2Z34_10425 [Planctomycetes bacterium RBG_16_59_8]|nr:MAG: hypothetical protein A2Z34_10425 [Planctomycetes bacterium RBG_16_59_8]
MKGTNKVLVVDDDANIARICAHFLAQDGWEAESVPTAAEASAKILNDRRIGILFLDLRLPDRNGIDLLRELRSTHPKIKVIMISAHGTMESAVACMQEGAVDFLPKPFTRESILGAVMRASRFGRIEEEVTRLHTVLRERYQFANIVGGSLAMKGLYDRMGRAAETDSTITILGESGVGKDMVARAIHFNSRRSEGPFIPINCAALPGDLIESELFGYKKGAFTGASIDAVGLFRAADGGTVFLDEITEIPVATQSKLLRVLQDKKVRPVGGTEESEADVRVICSTNKDLDAEVAKGNFRQDLFYRISVITIHIPPLRERKEDIPSLVNHFIAKFNRDFHRSVRELEKEAMNLLANYEWLGNVRELEHALECAFAMSKGDVITLRDLPQQIRRASDRESPMDGILTLAAAEGRLVRRALAATGMNKSAAARMLGITRKRLYNLIRRHRLRT